MNSRGYAMAAVLIISSIMLTSAIRLSLTIHREYRLASGEWNRVRLRAAALSGIEIGRWLLEQDAGETDGATDNWVADRNMDMGGVDVSIRITDEQSRINAARLVFASGERNEPLWDLARVRFSDFSSAANDIELFLRSQWSRNTQAMLSPGLLRGAPGMRESSTPEAMTIFGNGLVNINSSDVQMLGALFNDDLESDNVRRIVAERSSRAFQSVFEMKERVQLSDEQFRRIFSLICVNSSWFRIRVEGEIGDVRHCMEAIVQRAETTHVIRFREWSR